MDSSLKGSYDDDVWRKHNHYTVENPGSCQAVMAPFSHITFSTFKYREEKNMHERRTQQEYTPDVKAMTRKKRVCAYARVSGDHDEAYHSLSAQVSYYQKLISDHPDWEFVEVFSDRGITGTKDTREGFQAMLSACRDGKVDIILAKSITRFARNTVILLETIRELKKLGIDIHFEEEHIETLSSKGELMISILAARAQEESRSASENQLWRIKKSYEKGIPVTGNCLGYRMVDHQFLIDDEEEQIVQRIFSMYLSGMGKTAIAKQLTKEGIKNRLGEVKWSPTGIAKILRNEKYLGDLKLQKSYITDYVSKKHVDNHGEKPAFYTEDSHEGIISKESFNAVQEEISRRAKAIRLNPNPEHAVFSKLIRCGKCGKHFCRCSANAGSKYSKPAWGCWTSSGFGLSSCEMGQKIPENILEKITCEILRINEPDENVIRSNIEEIIVPERNVLVFKFKDGKEERVEWKNPSRRESWTPEMRERARQQMLARNKAKKEKENKHGT